MIFLILPSDICPRVVNPEATDGSYPIHLWPSKSPWNIRSICRKTLSLNLVVGNSEKLERNCWFGLVEWFNMYSGALLFYQKGLFCAQFWSFLVTWCIWLFWGQLHPLKGKDKKSNSGFFYWKLVILCQNDKKKAFEIVFLNLFPSICPEIVSWSLFFNFSKNVATMLMSKIVPNILQPILTLGKVLLHLFVLKRTQKNHFWPKNFLSVSV